MYVHRRSTPSSHPDYPPDRVPGAPGLMSALSGYQFSDYADGPAHRFDVHHNGENVGYAQVESVRGGSFLDAVHVSEAHRGNGLANALMQRVISKFGGRSMTLHANPYGTGEGRLNTDQLKGMYAKHGFTEQGDGYM